MDDDDEQIANEVRQKMLNNSMEEQLTYMREQLEAVAASTGQKLYLKSIRHEYEESEGCQVTEMEINVAPYASIEALTLKVET